eukprot:1159752-Pelagomonas_calceolata.AAC.2
MIAAQPTHAKGDGANAGLGQGKHRPEGGKMIFGELPSCHFYINLKSVVPEKNRVGQACQDQTTPARTNAHPGNHTPLSGMRKKSLLREQQASTCMAVLFGLPFFGEKSELSGISKMSSRKTRQLPTVQGYSYKGVH